LREALSGVIASWHEMPLRNSLDLQSARAITELIIDNDVDVVHAHVGRDYLVSALACKQAKLVRLVITRHHYLPMKRNALYRWMLKDVSAVIAVSDTVRKSVIERLQLPEERVHTIPNWIEPDRFQPIEREAARAMFQMRASIVVACIGQLTPAKGQEEFLRAAARIASMRSDVEFVVAGDEYEDGRPFTRHLNKVAAELGLAARVRFMGYVRHIVELLAAVDVVVVPSWDEGFSLVALEAMAARRPVLASNVGGIAGIIRDNATGLLVSPRDVRALTDKLLWMVSDGPLRERLAAQAQRDAHARFSRDNVIDQIESVYQDSLEVEAAVQR
jgi:glycosyltransferase involved in cell wall biosynthesis